MISACHDPGFAAPIGKHIMPMRKFSLVASEIGNRGWADLIRPDPLDPEALLLVHDPAYILAIQTGEPRALAESQKFPWSPALWPSVLLTNAAVAEAGRLALENGIAAAVASGFHHSCADHGEGFCTFNGLVLAGEILRREGLLQRVAVLDMDLHYGNGTASLATSRPWLRQLSIYGNDYWDNFCFRDVSQRHHEDGPNHRSAALPAGTDWPQLEAIMRREIPWLLDEMRPDLLLYQAGADYLRDDPYSPLDLDHDALYQRDELVFQMTCQRGIPVAWTLAGGYTEDIAKVVEVHVNTFAAARAVYE